MLQPRNYPRLLGQALVLEPEPFVEMVDDDNPWVEGLFLCVCLGVTIGVAQVIGSLLSSAILPPPDAVLEAIIAHLRQNAGGAESVVELERTIRQGWPLFTIFSGYGAGWWSLFALATAPLGLILQWLLFSALSHLFARLLGGQGTLNQTLGAMALSTAPRTLLLLTVVPFVAVGAGLIHVWGVLIAYRGLQVAHELPVGRAALAALGPWLLFFFLAGAGSVLFGSLLVLVGGGP